jgi:hypothetical protein
VHLQEDAVGYGMLKAMRSLLTRFSRRSVLVFLLLGMVGLAGGWSADQQAPRPPATILLIRHAEKLTDGREDLSSVGFERAKVMPLLFGGTSAPHNLPRPDFLFATRQSKHSNRPVETITPLSDALGMTISHDVEDKDYAALATDLLSGKYAGKVLLVAWHHGSLPGFAKALGATPPYDPWPESQFDRVWRIDYRDGKAVLTDLPQGLMAGDSK